MSLLEIIWLTVGFGGQALFSARFLVQWLASERKGESVIPIAFWYLSLSGGASLLAYAIYRQDPVIITGQAFGVIVYVRNLVLIHRKQYEENELRVAHQEQPVDVNAETVVLNAKSAPLLKRAG
ncbi:lipid-A-disaccharide synthase [Planctomycetes bacterium Pan216]|uniref:Lipid-A-disaccharide synthase n=1 Tax=Kolteria novifilia TaxID=2527975 RepID=A0A518AXS3_9BACT|nr:lipid-A-disaccharide synthase [Planctomycetes bacterium Pan216]